MGEWTDSLGKAAIFLTPDANSGYWEIEIGEAKQHKPYPRLITVCINSFALPFGLRNAPVTLRRIQSIHYFRVCKTTVCIGFSEQLVIFSSTTEKHICHIRNVIALLNNAGVSLKLKKCQLSTETNRLFRTQSTPKKSRNRIPYDWRHTLTSRTDQHNGTQVLLRPIQRISTFCSELCTSSGPII